MADVSLMGPFYAEPHATAYPIAATKRERFGRKLSEIQADSGLHPALSGTT
jgi:hypothetical protein